MLAVKALKKAEKLDRNECKADGFPLAKMDDILKKEGASRRDLEEEAELHRWMDQWAGLPVGGQLNMFGDETPEEVKDDAYYEADGYQAGIRGLDADVPDHIPTRFHQAWLTGRQNGQEKIAWSMASVIDIRSRQPVAQADDGDLAEALKDHA